MKKRLLLTFCTLIVLALVGACKGKSDAPAEVNLTLKATKKVIVADGSDKVIFTVTDQSGKDVTSSCVFSEGGNSLFDNSFTSKKVGDFEIFAKNSDGVKSNTVKIKAVSEKANIEVRAQKTAIVADGGDLTTLSLWDKDNDVELVDDVKFFLDGKALDSNIVRLTAKGIYKVSATWKQKESKQPLVISGVDLRTVTGRSLIETLTATSCVYCASEIETIEKIEKKSDRAIVVAIHNQFSSVYSNILSKASLDDAKAFISTVAQGEHATPNSFVNRDGKKVKIGNIGVDRFVSQWIPASSDVAISIDTKIDGDKIKVKAYITGKTNVSGKIAAVLVENGRTAQQSNMGVIEMRQLMRAYKPSVEGEDISIEVGKAKVFETEFYIGSAKVENCNVIVFVKEGEGLLKNVQQVKVGSAIGY